LKIELSVSDERGVNIEEEERGTLLEVDSDTRDSLRPGRSMRVESGTAWKKRFELIRVRTPPLFRFPAVAGSRR